MNITIRISNDLAEAIENKRGDKSKADFYREIIEFYLSASEAGSNSSSKSEYTLRLENEITYLRAKVDELIRTLNQEQILHLQTQRMLPATQAETVKPKKWFEFWRK